MQKSSLNQIGDRTREWLRFEKEWKKNHPPQDNGCYLCGICGRWVIASEAVLDHIQSRSSAPHLVFVETNIQPAHFTCNQRKGSSYIEPVVGRAVYDFLEWMSNV